MTEKQILGWIKSRLSDTIKTAIDGSLYTEDWLAAMAIRETGILINQWTSKSIDAPAIFKLIKGDFSQRPGETAKQFHGFGFWQIDSKSFPDFVSSGDWQDPLKTCKKAVDVLNGKRNFIKSKTGLSGESLDRATTAAYNCGEGGVVKVINAHLDIDARTANKNYSAEVWRFRNIYRSL